MLGLHCSTWDLLSSLQHSGSFFFSCILGSCSTYHHLCDLKACFHICKGWITIIASSLDCYEEGTDDSCLIQSKGRQQSLNKYKICAVFKMTIMTIPSKQSHEEIVECHPWEGPQRCPSLGRLDEMLLGMVGSVLKRKAFACDLQSSKLCFEMLCGLQIEHICWPEIHPVNYQLKASENPTI